MQIAREVKNLLGYIIARAAAYRSYILPFLTVTLAKVSGAVFFFHSLELDTTDTYWMRAWGMTTSFPRWPFLFLGWDSGWYLDLALHGYHDPLTYAFFPGYPSIIYILNSGVRNVSVSAVLCSLVFGVAWIPFFQMVAEQYLPKPIALRCTLVMAFYPYLFVFTTVAYSESLFLFACTASWYFFLKNRIFYASILATVATFTRIVGVLIALPMLLDLVHRREWKHLSQSFIAPVAFLGWVGYCYVSGGDLLAFVNAQQYWELPANSWINHVTITNDAWEIFSLILIPIIIYHSRKVDWRLATYSLSYFFVVLLGSYTSIHRFLPFLFPLFITLFKWTNKPTLRFINQFTVVLCILFFSYALLLWNWFLLGKWIS